jgi:tetratricopeptide (TPR) repeat protein
MKRALQAAVFATLLAACGHAFAALPAPVAECITLRKHGQQEKSQACFQSLAKSNSPYLRAEGDWGLEQFTEANNEFRIAAAAETQNANYRVRWGMLFHARFNNSDAADLFHEALKIDPTNADAYLGLAMVSVDGFDGKAQEYAQQAATLDPKSAPAQKMLAQLAMENGEEDKAIQHADAAIALAPDALDAMAIRAAVEITDDRTGDQWLAKINAINPHYGEAYAIVAHALEMHYRYEDAITYYRKAIDADPRLWHAHSQLGIDLMRLGQEDEPRTQLEISYNNGYRDPATVNSLRLLDSYRNFVTDKHDGIILRMNKNEATLLEPYFLAEMQRIIPAYEKKYAMKAPLPVQVEVYPDHEDFAVRTMGMPGLGALGVTFGSVIAMDSPSSRKPGDFNWGSTLWHEMSHVFILTATDHRVPRWFTEGLAVHEEGNAQPEWKNRVTPEVLIAIRDKKLLPVADLDRGFVYPEYPSQVIVSYFQAGSICDYVAERWGESKLLDMVHSFAQHKTTADAVQINLGMLPTDFDKAYMQWLNTHYGKEAADFDAWRTQLRALQKAVADKQYDIVLKDSEALLKMYPEYIGDANVYQLLADTDEAKHDNTAAITVLGNYIHAGGEDPAMLKHLAALEDASGQQAQAATTLAQLNYIYPFDEDLHRKLGRLWLAQKNYTGAIGEFNAVIALKPLDMAGAEYELASAYYAAGQPQKAEDADLAALEAAPGYRPAQKLLLQIHQPKN